MVIEALLAACSLLLEPSANRGSISGTVVNVSQGKNAPCLATVVLRAVADGQFASLEERATDARGRFRFENLPLGREFQYLPGANRDGVHYPGPRVQLTPEKPHVSVQLTVCDAAQEPSPLLIRRHDIRIRPEPGALHVSESILVDNPSSLCFVGRSPHDGAQPITLQLSIPADFERATFDEEFFGRRFALVGDKLVTGIPWPPGQREVRLTYVLRNDQRHRVWQRPVDLPSAEVRVRVCGTKPADVACSLSPADADPDGEAVFESSGEILPGHVIRVKLGGLPVPWMVYGRWLALALLGALVAAAGMVMIRRRSAFRWAATAQ